MQAAQPTTTRPLGSSELAPPLPARPIQWRRGKQLLRELMATPEATDKVFELFAAMGGKGDEASVQRCAAHPEGRLLLAEKPSLLALLGDRAQEVPGRMVGERQHSMLRLRGYEVRRLLPDGRQG